MQISLHMKGLVSLVNYYIVNIVTNFNKNKLLGAYMCKDWSRTYSAVYYNVDKQIIWDLWSNPRSWATWNGGVERCEVTSTGPIAVGTKFTLKPKGGPAVKLEFLEFEKYKNFTDVTFFPGAKMFGEHRLEEVADGVKLTCTMKVTGLLGFFWRRIVAQKIVTELPQDFDRLVKLARGKRV